MLFISRSKIQAGYMNLLYSVQYQIIIICSTSTKGYLWVAELPDAQLLHSFQSAQRIGMARAVVPVSDLAGRTNSIRLK